MGLQTPDLMMASAGSVILPEVIGAATADDVTAVDVTATAANTANSTASGVNATATAVNGPATAANATWKGCVLSDHALTAGEVVLQGTANPQPSAEACCRSCATFTGGEGSSCNAWNYCGQAGGCSMRTTVNTVVQLAVGECECC